MSESLSISFNNYSEPSHILIGKKQGMFYRMPNHPKGGWMYTASLNDYDWVHTGSRLFQFKKGESTHLFTYDRKGKPQK